MKALSLDHPGNDSNESLMFLIANSTTVENPDFSAHCDDEFKKINTSKGMYETLSQTQTLVAQDPEKYHWCFYLRLSQISSQLQKDQTFKDQQLHLIETYSFLTPVARSFFEVFHDSRYLRWATAFYQKKAEIVFMRKTVLSPQGTMELSNSNPMAIYPQEIQTKHDKNNNEMNTENDKEEDPDKKPDEPADPILTVNTVEQDKKILFLKKGPEKTKDQEK
jgi:hypothetical protein